MSDPACTDAARRAPDWSMSVRKRTLRPCRQDADPAGAEHCLELGDTA
jgi:hypothetical protein